MKYGFFFPKIPPIEYKAVYLCVQLCPTWNRDKKRRRASDEKYRSSL